MRSNAYQGRYRSAFEEEPSFNKRSPKFKKPSQICEIESQFEQSWSSVEGNTFAPSRAAALVGESEGPSALGISQNSAIEHGGDREGPGSGSLSRPVSQVSKSSGSPSRIRITHKIKQDNISKFLAEQPAGMTKMEEWEQSKSDQSEQDKISKESYSNK